MCSRLSPQRLGLTSLLLLLVTVALVSSVSAQPKTERVVILTAYDPSYPAFSIINQNILSTIRNGSTARTEFYFEFQENARISNSKYEKEMVSYLQRKYEGENIALVIALGGTALRFLLDHESELFKNVPKTYYFHDEPPWTADRLWPNVTGVWARLEVDKTLNTALSLHPDTESVVVVSGSSSEDKSLRDQAHAAFRKYEDRLRFTYLDDVTIDELKSKLAALPPKTVVIYIGFFLDKKGNSYTGPEALSIVAPTANAPIYGIAETYLGAGIVGGNLLDFEALGKAVGNIGLRLKAGEKPGNITPQTVPTVAMFDWRQLQRWQVDQRKLPANSVVRFERPTFWAQYKWYIIAAIVGFTIQTLLIIGLLIMRSRRRQSEERFAKAFRANPQPMSLTTMATGLYLDVNESFLSMSGYTREEVIGHTSLELEIWEDKQARVSFIEQLRRDGVIVNVETRFRTKDRSIRVLLSSAERLDIAGQECLLVASSDVTERRESEVKLRTAHEELHRLKNQLEAENVYLQEELQSDRAFGEIVGESEVLKSVLFKIQQVAPTDSTVLIEGETGTGKELVARAIHGASSRKDRPLIKVNCGALSSTLIESELFGHEKGAFTGAVARRAGRFELANGGTIFLDEIGELPLELQVKLLRVIQENEFERLGGTKTIKADLRIIAATNRNLKREVESGGFREDLWYRLNVYPITVPPLRERKEDIPLLVEHFVKRYAKKSGKTITSVSPKSRHSLQTHSWPGNVRELASVIERAVIHTKASVLTIVDHFGEEVVEESSSSLKSLEEVEREYINRVLEDTGWRVEGPYGAAKILGLNPSTLRTRMLKLGIQRRSAVARN